MYAIAEDRNRQIRVTPGETVLLDYRDEWQPGAEVVLEKVCLIGGDETKIGTPYLEGASIVLEVKGESKGAKVVVRKFKRRKNYRVKTGFRAKYVRALVKEIHG